MEGVISFLGSHVFLFVILGLISLFALVGFFVDQSEQKKGISKIIKPEEERDIKDLAQAAVNKSLNNAITDAARKNSNLNTITDTTQSSQVKQTSNVGFNVLNK